MKGANELSILCGALYSRRFQTEMHKCFSQWELLPGISTTQIIKNSPGCLETMTLGVPPRRLHCFHAESQARCLLPSPGMQFPVNLGLHLPSSETPERLFCCSMPEFPDCAVFQVCQPTQTLRGTSSSLVNTEHRGDFFCVYICLCIHSPIHFASFCGWQEYSSKCWKMWVGRKVTGGAFGYCVPIC